MKISWDESMSTGVERLDIQHRQLIEKFNDFSEIINQPSLARQAAGEVLDFLQFYAKWHFGQEEECMEQHNCPVAAANKNAHAEFIAMFSEFYEKWQSNTMDIELARKTHAKLAEWIMNHIVHTDTRLRGCIKQ